MRLFSLILLFSLTLFSFDESSGHFIEALPKRDIGKKLYEEQCASCHHKDRIGLEGPPLYSKTLRKYKDISALAKKIKNGFPQTLMPKFEHLSDIELIKIAEYIKRPLDSNISWTKADIENSIKLFNDPKNELKIKNMANVTPVVERGANKIWIMEDDKILAKFNLSNVHGGIKYQFPKAQNIFIPTRDGWVEKYSLKEGRRVAKVRDCINLRNVSLSRDGKYGFTSCLLPQQLVIFDTKTLKPIKIVPLDGKVSAIYQLYSKDLMIFTLRDKPVVAFVNSKNFNINYFRIKEPIEDFFIDPFEKYLIATARRGKLLRVYSINPLKLIFEEKISGMPHLFSATYWYRDGKFFFATPHLRSNFITIWQMYNWKLIKKVDVGGDGFFAKTHPATPYLWVDNGSDELVLVSKKDFSIKKLIPRKNKRYIHAEFSGDGKYTYLSIYERDGDLLVWDTKSFKEIKDYKANIPVGKYNFICKNRRFYPMLFGIEIKNEKFPKDSVGEIFKKVISHDVKLNEYELKSILAYIKYMEDKKDFK